MDLKDKINDIRDIFRHSGEAYQSSHIKKYLKDPTNFEISIYCYNNIIVKNFLF